MIVKAQRDMLCLVSSKSILTVVTMFLIEIAFDKKFRCWSMHCCRELLSLAKQEHSCSLQLVSICTCNGNILVNLQKLDVCYNRNMVFNCLSLNTVIQVKRFATFSKCINSVSLKFLKFEIFL